MKAIKKQLSPPPRLSASLERNLQTIREETGGSPDVKIRRISPELADRSVVEAAIVFIDGLSNLHTMLQPLLAESSKGVTEAHDAAQLLTYFKRNVISQETVEDAVTMDALFAALMKGSSIILLDGCPTALIVGTKDIKARSVEEPNVQSVVRGPREGFTEVLSWNTAMVRRKIADRQLWTESLKLGRVTQTDVTMMYVRHLVNDEVLKQVRERIAKIDIDGILESNYIEEHIQEKRYTPFPTIFNSERPDVVAAGLLEGRVAILVDGTPFALLVPALFTQFFQSSEDYYQRADFGTLIRLLRFFAFVLALLTPSVFIAITTFHQEMLPTTLLYNLASQREGTPLPAFIEALLMEITFEILREASVRMPKTIGQSISIVGTLVIGQAAVEAGMVSAAMVIVVSITAISNFVLPAFNLGIATRIIRFALMGLAATFGLFGIFIGLIIVVLHLCSLTSFCAAHAIFPFRSEGHAAADRYSRHDYKT